MSIEKRRILIVEDDLEIRNMLTDRLDDYEIAICTTQEDCYGQLPAGAFDVVLLDLRLPTKADDMIPDNNVGIDILKHIRQRNLRQRNSARVLPVIVMTAHGSQRISASVLVEHGANDYIAKPFGGDDELERKLERAIGGTGGLVPAADLTLGCFHISFDQRVVRIDSFAYPDIYDLMKVLIDFHAKSQGDLLPWEDHHSIKSRELAKKLDIGDQALRRRIARFRKQVANDFLTLGRTLDLNDIIENERRWQGYRLNPRKVHVFRGSTNPK